MIDASKITVGTQVCNGSLKGFVDMVTDEGNYVRLQWAGTKRPDILSKQSPLWLHLTVYK